MGRTLNVLIRLFVWKFYEQNGAFFLFWGILLFGTVSPEHLPEYHETLLRTITSSPYLYSGILIIWFLYSLKCTKFITNSIKQYKEAFLHVLRRVNSKKQYLLMGICFTLVFFPVLIHGLGIAALSIIDLKSRYAIFSILFLTIISAGCTIRLVNQLKLFTNSTTNNFRFIKSPNSLPFNWILLRFILLKQKRILIALKPSQPSCFTFF